MSFSVFGDDSPPSIPTPSGFNYLQRNSPVVIEPNVSYTRGGQTPLNREGPRANSPHPGTPNNGGAHGIPNHAPPNHATSNTTISHEQSPNSGSQEEPTEEDARFLRLAHEALIATSTESNLIVDPTIQDLLARLQYVLSPHGNPIKLSNEIESNENGQLMIQKFYKGFPNLSNDIFIRNSENNPANKKSEGWNFLLDKPLSPAVHENNENGENSENDRKFPCQGCTMLFRRSSDLKRHAKQHLSVPANICPHCGKGFARRDALKRHAGTLTCKRNAEKKLYKENLDFLKEE